jgi:hypothetical protein
LTGRHPVSFSLFPNACKGRRRDDYAKHAC